ncbi:MAG: PRC-barrel domain-containing protein [Clostridiales bacterium]|nr:PRC-barrel domain-containing protein [Eubacteriales bacterium]MDH7565522.1 PRC-barrel domain-containing protein [Clostridiales bacterium]
MEKYSEVVGLPVICAETGKTAGTVKDVVFCPKSKEVKAFLLERKGFEIKNKAILLEDVLSLGRDALVVSDFKKAVYLDKIGEKGEVIGLKVYSRSGDDLGVVKDILFDYRTGTIEGVELSDGLLQDIVQGRKILPLFGKVEFSEENILVDGEASEEMDSTGGGLKNLLKWQRG